MKSISFNSEGIKAILDNRKTQTRRIIKNIPEDFNFIAIQGFEKLAACFYNQKLEKSIWINLKYGKVGDRFKLSLPESEPCPACGYTKRDKRLQGDHHLCFIYKLNFEIIDIKVERVQEINNGDIQKEGFLGDMIMVDGYPWFKNLWNKIYGKDAWDKNEWCWCIEFKGVK